MRIHNWLSKTLIVSVLSLASAAQAVPITATLNPQANNGGLGVLNPAVAAFQAAGFASALQTTMTINANSGNNVAFTETGRFDITSFFNSANVQTAVLPAVGAGWGVYGLLNVSGTGNWAGTTYTANSASLSLGFTLFGHKQTGGADFVLGTGSLDTSFPSLLFAIAFGSVAPGAAGTALTSMSASAAFTPAVGTVGAGGFFQAPNPFNIDLSFNNAGGNTPNTGYSVSNTGVVTIITPTPGSNGGTANVTFVDGQISSVPEPDVVALWSIALMGLAFVGKRRKTAANA
jgi:prepilin-type processing-associated H-X9-DG protein